MPISHSMCTDVIHLFTICVNKSIASMHIMKTLCTAGVGFKAMLLLPSKTTLYMYFNLIPVTFTQGYNVTFLISIVWFYLWGINQEIIQPCRHLCVYPGWGGAGCLRGAGCLCRLDSVLSFLTVVTETTVKHFSIHTFSSCPLLQS